MAANPDRPSAPTATAVLVAALALAGCELGLHEVQQATNDGCEAWQARCPAVIDFAGPGPINPAPVDIARARIVTSAENAPYRPCDGVGLVCQARVSGDVLWDQYILVLAGETNASVASADSDAAAVSPAPAPAAAGAPAVAPPPAASGQIFRTEGTRPGDGGPPQITPPR